MNKMGEGEGEGEGMSCWLTGQYSVEIRMVGLVTTMMMNG